MPELVIENGAGLSRVERLSAASMNRLLQFAWRSAMMPELVASLPLAGVDGTMKKRLQNEGITGQAHIKTGTLDGVKSMAGYVRDQCGRYWVVVFMVNHPNAAQAGMAMDALLQTVWAQDKRSKAKISSHPFMQPVHSSDHAQTPNADD
jgi:D-alanyl-D-alanine carboxypeptidase/D-alanyl-D-alanine-endopeptidase (penicillin-binding protein 4)